MDFIATLVDDFQKVTRMLATDEVAIRTLGFELIGQRQAAHYMADTYLQGGIGPNRYAHFQCTPSDTKA
jgi:hypothetical protein